MNKQELLNFISKVIDNGGRIEITQYGWNTTKAEAEQFAQELQVITGNTVVAHGGERTRYFQVGNGMDRVLGHFFYSPYLVEDITLDGSDFDDREAI